MEVKIDTPPKENWAWGCGAPSDVRTCKPIRGLGVPFKRGEIFREFPVRTSPGSNDAQGDIDDV
jgi:hypothetical protein